MVFLPLLSGMRLYLKHLHENDPGKLASGDYIVGDVIVDRTASIGQKCKIGKIVCSFKDCSLMDIT